MGSRIWIVQCSVGVLSLACGVATLAANSPLGQQDISLVGSDPNYYKHEGKVKCFEVNCTEVGQECNECENDKTSSSVSPTKKSKYTGYDAAAVFNCGKVIQKKCFFVNGQYECIGDIQPGNNCVNINVAPKQVPEPMPDPETPEPGPVPVPEPNPDTPEPGDPTTIP